jgi:antitoxin component YwqK of YwqJK toxin-antitoxin module
MVILQLKSHMKTPFLPLLLAFLVGFSSCETAEKEPALVKDASGRLIAGISKNYYDDGKIRNEVPVKDGMRHGVAREYYESGQLAAAIEYQADQKNGWSKWYYKDGILYQEAQFVANQKEGIEKKYYNTGELMAVLKWKGGKTAPGLLEYQLNGKAIKQPSIVVQEKAGKWEIRLSNGATNVKFYRGSLGSEEAFDEEAHTLLATIDGVASLPIDDQALQVIAVRRSNMKNQQVLLYTAQP